jgi:tRNA pseudouridine55 synthase
MTRAALENGSTLLVDKPLEWTSFDVVKAVFKKTGVKTGHAGTLDPLATGLLILCTGKSTKQISAYQNLEKTYTGSFMLGASTPSFDRETTVDHVFSTDHITEEQVHAAAEKFCGVQLQMPPVFSAVKQRGVPVYRKARRGMKVELQPREIVVHQFRITQITMPMVEFEIVCSKGTYIRALARDFGDALGSGAHLFSLRRTAIGKHQVTDAWQLDDLLRALSQLPE